MDNDDKQAVPALPALTLLCNVMYIFYKFYTFISLGPSCTSASEALKDSCADAGIARWRFLGSSAVTFTWVTRAALHWWHKKRAFLARLLEYLAHVSRVNSWMSMGDPQVVLLRSNRRNESGCTHSSRATCCRDLPLAYGKKMWVAGAQFVCLHVYACMHACMHACNVFVHTLVFFSVLWESEWIHFFVINYMYI